MSRLLTIRHRSHPSERSFGKTQVSANPTIGRPPAFVYRKSKGQKNSELHCEASRYQLAKKLDTPLYVYSANTFASG